MSSDSPISVQPWRGSMAEWDSMVLSRTDTEYSHLSAWKAIVQETFGHDTQLLVAVSGSREIVGLMTITAVSSLLFGKRQISPAFLNYGGPVGTPAAVRALVLWAKETAQTPGQKGGVIRARSALPIPGSVHEGKVTVEMELPGSDDALFKGFPSKLRSQIRRAARDGATAVHGIEFVDEFYSVYRRNMRDLGSPALPLAFFRRITDSLSTYSRVCVIRHEGTPIAAGFGFQWHGTLEMTWASSLREYNKMAPNMMLYWSMMRQAIADEARVFDFGRCTPGSGPHKFKLQWGGVGRPLPWYLLSSDGKAGPQKEQPIFRIARRMWCHMPLMIADHLGPLLVSGLP